MFLTRIAIIRFFFVQMFRFDHNILVEKLHQLNYNFLLIFSKNDNELLWCKKRFDEYHHFEKITLYNKKVISLS